MKKSVTIIGIVILFGLIAGGIYYSLGRLLPSEQNPPETQTTHPPCLGDNEVTTFQFHGNRTTATSADVIISNKITGEELSRFRIDDLVPHYYSYEFHKCGTYVIRQFNYNIKTRRATPHYRIELWRYNYTGRGETVLLFSETDDKGIYTSYFDDDFRIDPQEIYIALEYRYPDSSDYDLGFRDFNNKTDNFILSRQSLLKRYPELIGYLGLERWTKNGDYFWGDLSIGADEIAYIRILRDIWKFDVLPVPGGTLGGTAFNPEFGYVTYDTGPGWIGIDVIAEQVYEEWRKAGKKVDFYLYNLFTKEKTLLTTTDNPAWSFKPQWISDTELQYELPTGEKKIYKIEQ